MSYYMFIASDKPLDYLTNIKDMESPYIIDTQDSFLIDNEDFHETREYTDKKHSAYLKFDYSDKIAKTIIKYIEKQLEATNEIELWGVWLGDNVKSVIKKCSIDDLTIEHIKELWEDKDFYTPKCLNIYNNAYVKKFLYNTACCE